MNRVLVLLAVTAATVISASAMPQPGEGKFGIGLDVGARKIYGDFKQEGIGVGAGGLVSYKLLPFADITLGFGYSQLKYNKPSTTTNMLNFDLKGNLEIISKGLFRPYVTVGAGLLNFDSGSGRTSVRAIFGGGGFRLHLSPKFNLFLGTDYRFVDTDALDGNSNLGTAKDGYFDVSSGVVYTLGGGQEEFGPDVIAAERAPFTEVEGESQYFDQTAQNNQGGYSSGNETNDMQEYVKLKSKVDRLSNTNVEQDQEIDELKRRLIERKKMLSTMKNKASRSRKKNLKKNTAMSGFSQIYEQALVNYYNKEYSEGVSLFRLLLQQYSNHALVSNCQYWIGQSLYAMNRYQEAIDEFYKVLGFNRSLKKDDALLLLGKAYLKIGSGDRARESFVRLMQDHPTSEFVEEAKEYVARL